MFKLLLLKFKLWFFKKKFSIKYPVEITNNLIWINKFSEYLNEVEKKEKEINKLKEDLKKK